MKRSRLVAAVLAITASQAILRADLTIIMTNTVEGPMAALGGAEAPRITMRIQGLKARTDMDVMGRAFVGITDVAAKQIIMLDPAQKTVHRMMSDSMKGTGRNFEMPNMESTVEPTGQTRDIGGQSCSEVRMVMAFDMAQIGGAQLAPDMRDAMKDMKMVMKGSAWISKSAAGASEFIKFQAAARAAGMALPTNPFGGQNALDPLTQALARADGLPCLSEIELSYEGTGPMVEMLKKMGTMKVSSRVSDISLAPLAPDTFAVPSDYTESPIQNPLIPRH